MQNTMLDSTVSSNSQELFDFNAEHNGEACIASLDPKDRGTERQFRFTRALLCTLLGVKSEDTITNHVDKLLKRGVIDNTKNLVLSRSEHGRETTQNLTISPNVSRLMRAWQMLPMPSLTIKATGS